MENLMITYIATFSTTKKDSLLLYNYKVLKEAKEETKLPQTDIMKGYKHFLTMIVCVA